MTPPMKSRPIETPAIDGLAGGREQGQAFLADMAKGVPLGRVGQPDEIAKAVVFLASDDAQWITGSVYIIDGGSLAWRGANA